MPAGESEFLGRKMAAKSILVVEDEPNIVLSLQFLMKKAGFDVRVARDGDEALAEVRSRAPDLILLDVMIPKRDGYDVCQTIRANPAWQSIYIIMLTAKGRRSIAKGYRAGRQRLRDQAVFYPRLDRKGQADPGRGALLSRKRGCAPL